MNLPSKVFIIFLIFISPEFISANWRSPKELLSLKTFCTLSAWADNVVKFGKDGQNGQNGKDGQKGRNSENLTIFSDGSPLNLDLVGQKGLTGEDGSPGENSICDTQPLNSNNNLKGARGGEGGNGGNGGDGGDGASLTIYTTDRNSLKQILVKANGGIGGEAGKGGQGGSGCQCTQIFWTIKSCNGNPNSADYSCTTKEYNCTNGEQGQNGRSGSNGREGKIGNLTLINSDKPLAPDRLTASVSMADLKNRGLSLSKNLWENKTGAASLFAPGSIIGDRYLELVQRVEKSIVLIWNAPQSFEPFANTVVNLNLQDNGTVDIKIPDNIWVESSLLERNNVAELFIFNILKQEEATRLESKGLTGNGSNLTLELIDKAERSDIITTQFKVRYSVTKSDEVSYREVFDYSPKYDAEVPPSLIRYSGNRFLIDLGQLPIDSKHLQRNTAVEVQVQAIRSFGTKSATQTITVRQILGR